MKESHETDKRAPVFSSKVGSFPFSYTPEEYRKKLQEKREQAEKQTEVWRIRYGVGAVRTKEDRVVQIVEIPAEGNRRYILNRDFAGQKIWLGDEVPTRKKKPKSRKNFLKACEYSAIRCAGRILDLLGI